MRTLSCQRPPGSSHSWICCKAYCRKELRLPATCKDKISRELCVFLEVTPQCQRGSGADEKNVQNELFEPFVLRERDTLRIGGCEEGANAYKFEDRHLWAMNMGYDERTAEFVQLMTVNQRPLYTHILVLMPNWSDAEDILQQTNLRLWDEFERFKPGTNFLAWAKQVAYFEVLTARKKLSRSKLVFDLSLIDELSRYQELELNRADIRRKALEECLSELSNANRELLCGFYSRGTSIKGISESLGRSIEAVYKMIQRLRISLRVCIESRITEGEGTP